jgi:hypothetical protein
MPCITAPRCACERWAVALPLVVAAPTPPVGAGTLAAPHPSPWHQLVVVAGGQLERGWRQQQQQLLLLQGVPALP